MVLKEYAKIGTTFQGNFMRSDTFMRSDNFMRSDISNKLYVSMI